MTIIRKHRTWTVRAQTWDFIEKRYMEDWQGRHEKILELVRHIKHSDFNGRIFGSTSMDKLIVSIYDPIDYNKEALHIKFDLLNRKWIFEYIALPSHKPEFTRIYDEDMGIVKFDKFMKMINW